MAKKKLYPGSVVPRKDGKGLYLKVNIDSITFTNDGESITLKKGDYLDFSSKQNQLESLKEGLEEGRLSQDLYDKLSERAEKIPDFVVAEMSVTRK